jgi:hypothetical protein
MAAQEGRFSILASLHACDLRITRVFSCVVRRFKADAYFRFTGCC